MCMVRDLECVIAKLWARHLNLEKSFDPRIIGPSSPSLGPPINKSPLRVDSPVMYESLVHIVTSPCPGYIIIILVVLITYNLLLSRYHILI